MIHGLWIKVFDPQPSFHTKIQRKIRFSKTRSKLERIEKKRLVERRFWSFWIERTSTQARNLNSLIWPSNDHLNWKYQRSFDLKEIKGFVIPYSKKTRFEIQLMTVFIQFLLSKNTLMVRKVSDRHIYSIFQWRKMRRESLEFIRRLKHQNFINKKFQILISVWN